MKVENSNNRAHEDLAKDRKKNDGLFAFSDDRFQAIEVKFLAVNKLDKDLQSISDIKATKE